MPDPGANQRIEPLPITGPIHLHERNGFGLAGQSKKDPTNAVNGQNGDSGGYPPIPGFFPPPILLPPLDFPPFLPPPTTFPPEAGGGAGMEPQIPAANPPPFPFVYAGGAWWAPVQYDCDTGMLLDEPVWAMFAPVCCNCPPADPGMEMLAVMVAAPE